MFGIEDPGIWSAYLLGFGCLVFALYFGIRNWNKEDNNDKSKNIKKKNNE
ncbi:hypothetical protein LJB98_00855 [Bacteroidales bacterium OttesenSCG-928-M11]|nr:hypothetical protein [Bacteroidales bacterium OttesenSCG-928-M11]